MSGATHHITNNKRGKTVIETVDEYVIIGNGKRIPVSQRGTIKMTMKEGILLTLNMVLYIPCFTKNIVSVTELMARGTVVTMKADLAELHQGDQLIVVEKEKGVKGMFYLKGKRIVEEPQVLVVALTNHIEFNKAHELLGHANKESIIKIAKEQGWTLTGVMDTCGSCALAKAKPRQEVLPKWQQPGLRSQGRDSMWTSVVLTTSPCLETVSG